MSLLGTFIIMVVIVSIPFGLTFFVAWRKQMKRNSELTDINNYLLNQHLDDVIKYNKLTNKYITMRLEGIEPDEEDKPNQGSDDSPNKPPGGTPPA